MQEATQTMTNADLAERVELLEAHLFELIDLVASLVNVLRSQATVANAVLNPGMSSWTH